MIKEERIHKDITDIVSDEAMERLSAIMNDSPTIKKLSSTEWRITALKPGTMHMIVEEACKIKKIEKATLGDIIKELAMEIPSIVRILTLSLLNDKRKIENKQIYNKVYETLMWKTKQNEWIELLVEILNMIDVDFFFASTKLIEILRQRSLARKITEKEQTQLSREQNGDK